MGGAGRPAGDVAPWDRVTDACPGAISCPNVGSAGSGGAGAEALPALEGERPAPGVDPRVELGERPTPGVDARVELELGRGDSGAPAARNPVAAFSFSGATNGSTRVTVLPDRCPRWG